jgi:hypothetical protein
MQEVAPAIQQPFTAFTEVYSAGYPSVQTGTKALPHGLYRHRLAIRSSCAK